MIEAPTDKTPPWLEIAFTQHGVREIPGTPAHPKIVAYHATTTLRATSDEVPWCSSFANWCMISAGYEGTRDARARSWLDWGEPLSGPRLGCVAVFAAPKRGPKAGHVAFWWMYRGELQAWVYGGNHGNSVGLGSYDQADLLGFRWPVQRLQTT